MRKFPRYFRSGAVVAAIILGLFTIDRVLGTLEHSEVQNEARAQYRSGRLELQRGNRQAALTAMRRAHALARTSLEYSIGLSEALIANGSASEAESMVRDVLGSDSNDGTANLLLARLLAARGDATAAIAFYHRAIYGSWHSNSQEASAVRMELAEYLAREHRSQELLSELLLVEDSAAHDPALARRLAPLFIAAGSGARAADVYRLILKEAPHDGQAIIGLGEAALLSGDYREAESMFLRALRFSPASAELPHRLKFANELAMLDPTPRRLSSEAKYERAMTLLTAIAQQVSTCPRSPSSDPAVVTEVEKAIASRARARITNEIAELRLALAERLWQFREENCTAAPTDDATATIMRKLKRTQ